MIAQVANLDKEQERMEVCVWSGKNLGRTFYLNLAIHS